MDKRDVVGFGDDMCYSTDLWRLFTGRLRLVEGSGLKQKGGRMMGRGPRGVGCVTGRFR